MRSAAAGKFLVLFALCGLCGCQFFAARSEKSPPGPGNPSEAGESVRPAGVDQHIRNNSASLLYDLLNNEKNLSKLLIIKRESKALNELVKAISTSAGNRAKKLEQLAKADPTLDLHALGLPSGEAATRKAIAKTKQHELLSGKGPDFEFKLLLTQVEALNYGVHLAKVAAEKESRPDAAREFSAISSELQQLYERVVSLLRTSK